MIKVCLSGIYYPLAMLRYFERAFKRLASRGEIELFTIGPYTGTWIPWGGGMQLPAKYAIAPDSPLPAQVPTNLSIGFAEGQLPWVPDVWVQVDAGFHFKGKPRAGKNFIVATDPHVLDYGYQRTVADKLFCMQTPYAQTGDEYLPYAFDPEVHYPEEQPENYDVVLIGLHYAQRTRLVEDLRARGLRVYYDLGPAFDEYRQLNCQGWTTLNWSSREDLVARVWEGLGMGRLVVTNRVPDLGRFFAEGRDLIVFENHDDAVEKILWYSEHRYEARVIAETGHKTVQPHTWDARVRQILEMV